MNKFYAVVVAIEMEDEKGKMKTNRENYLVSAVSCLDAETTTVKHITAAGETANFTIKSVKETNYLEVL